MDIDQYQQKARLTAFYPNISSNLWYPALGLAGETGETVEKIKKVYRDYNGDASELTDAILEELGDVLWYLANIASELGVNLNEVAERNLRKLLNRKMRGTLAGSGDNR